MEKDITSQQETGVEDADNASSGLDQKDEGSLPQPAEDAAHPQKPHDDESKQEGEEQTDFKDTESDGVSHVEDTPSQDVGAIIDTAESSSPVKASEDTESQSELKVAEHEALSDLEDEAKVDSDQALDTLGEGSPVPDSLNQMEKEEPHTSAETPEESAKDVRDDLQFSADKDATERCSPQSPLPAVAIDDEAQMMSVEEETEMVDSDQALDTLGEGSPVPDSLNQIEKEEPHTSAETPEESAKDVRDDLQFSADKDATERCSPQSPLPAVAIDDEAQMMSVEEETEIVDSDQALDTLGEGSPVPDSLNQMEKEEPHTSAETPEESAKDVRDDLQFSADKDATERCSPQSPLHAVAIDDEAQMMSVEEETETEHETERGDDGWSEDIGKDALPDPQQSCKDEDSLQELDKSLDIEIDTSEAKEIHSDGDQTDRDKEIESVEGNVETQEAGYDMPMVETVTGSQQADDGGQLQTDLRMEDDRILGQHITDDIEGGCKVDEEGIGHSERQMITEEEDQLLSEDTQNNSHESSGHFGETTANRDANLSLKDNLESVMETGDQDINEEGRITDQEMTGVAEGGVREDEIDCSERSLTSQEEDHLLSEDSQRDANQPLNQVGPSLASQDSNLSYDEPMDTSEGEVGTGSTFKGSDNSEGASAMETSDQIVISNVLSESEGSGLPAPSTEVPANTEDTMSGAEALVRGSEPNSESSVKIKKEILTEVMTETHATPEAEASKADGGISPSNPVPEKDQDMKPSKAELDRILNTSSTNQTSLGDAESTPVSQAKKGKGSSITSIVGRLFNKKEEEARKRKETSPEEPPDEIANVPFKISGVKSLAAPEQAAKHQQRQEMRQTAGSPIVIASVTSLAKEVEKCSKCSKQIESESSAFKWQKELFCSFSCLDTTRITSTKTVTCDSCTVVLHPRIRNVHFAKVGKEMREFCSTRCAKNSEESPKLCPGCGKDVSTSGNPILAQTGSEGIFFEFCTQNCVNQYEERILNDTNKEKEIAIARQIKAVCTECETVTDIRYEFVFHQVKKQFCSEACFDSFRMKYNAKIDRCSACNCMCFNDPSAGLSTTLDGKTYPLCNENCKNAFTKKCTSCSLVCIKRSMVAYGDGEARKLFCAPPCRDSYQKKHGSLPPSSIYQCLTGSNNPAIPQRGPPPLTPLTNVHVPTTTSGVPQSITSNQASNSLPQQGQQHPQQTGPQPTKCDHCQKVQRPLYHLTMSDRTLRDFCSYNCVISFQAQFNVPPVTLPEETLLLRCHKCQRGFNTRPFVLDYEDKTSLFCSEHCLEDYKRTNCVFVRCDQCHQEKILYEKTHFSGEPRTFCSQGCMLLFKQEIVQTLGLQCIVCDYCAQMCKQDVSQMMGGIKRHFCKPECMSKYEQWFYKVARCDGCKNTGRELTEKFTWRGQMKQVCNQQCLLLFYTQQNIPNVTTQLPEPIPTSTAQHATPTIAKVMSLAPMERLSAPRTIVKENKKSFTNKQTQITTNTVYIKPPPPPPSGLPPPPKMVRNKITSCRPIQITKATMCRPIMKDMCVGTDFPRVPALVPIPFPVFIPVPMQMYTTHIPHPMAIPIPVPAPMFVPVAARDCNKLLKTMEEIKDRVPSDPLEAELFMMAAAVASDEDEVSDLGSEQIASRKRDSASEKEGSITSLGQRTRASLVDQAMMDCGIMDEPIDDMGVDELLASLSSPDVSDDILLMNADLEDDDEREKKDLLLELSQGLDALGHIPESEADPPPPLPLTKKVTRITLKKKPKKRKRRVRRKRASAPPAPSSAPAPPPQDNVTGLGLRRSSRAKRTKVYVDEDSQEDVDDDEEEYEPSVSSSSEEEIVETVEEPIDPQPIARVPTLPPTDDAWVTAGLLAYKLFVMGLDESLKPLSQRIKPNLLECSPDIIHRALIQFVRDARRPDGEPYSPETILLMCLSIQRHLTDNGRLDNFLAGPSYEHFRICLHNALSPWVPNVHPTTGLLLNSRINEEMMWASQQLGAHSPHVLLSTIFFFNCRNLRMRTAEEHSKLAFFRMQKLVKKANTPSGKVSLLRYFPPKKKNDAAEAGKTGLLNIGRGKKREYDPETLDQSENTENQLRCPVKLYEFYLSKCPESIKMRNEIFYLLPEHACIPDSPVWYSATKLPDEQMEKMLLRYGMIQEVQAGWQQKMKEEEEEAERAAELERQKEVDGEGDGAVEGQGSSVEQETH
ncbi:zinc finger MYM-type protein 3-like isoform X2 [Lytechinus variegatus]|uniref:zinc finger MYM-type protein 3-like isoform X2 n=1 Tax=Lytechinus variegatus TaxID=7654 RepID=UPI001BB14A7A|nr:zinc finger MYM-type protein 3-like isoform X2 [Lytechinus variegatus]